MNVSKGHSPLRNSKVGSTNVPNTPRMVTFEVDNDALHFIECEIFAGLS